MPFKGLQLLCVWRPQPTLLYHANPARARKGSLAIQPVHLQRFLLGSGFFFRLTFLCRFPLPGSTRPEGNTQPQHHQLPSATAVDSSEPWTLELFLYIWNTYGFLCLSQLFGTSLHPFLFIQCCAICQAGQTPDQGLRLYLREPGLR